MSRRLALFASASFAVGCAAPSVDDLADASGGMTQAVIVVEQRISAESAPQTSVSAKFMRLSAPVDPSFSERVVASKLDLPAFGSCRVESSAQLGGRAELLDATASGGRAGRGTIELIDVGDVSLGAGGSDVEVPTDKRVPLAVRAFPEVGDLVSGLFYTSPDTGTELLPGGRFTLEASGASGVDRFSVDVDALPALEDVRLAGLPLSEGVALEAGASGAGAELTWGPVSTKLARDEGDAIYADIAPLGDASTTSTAKATSSQSVRCAFRDTGAAELPAWVMARAAGGALVSVHRVRERSFTPQGIDTGELRFDVAVTGRVGHVGGPAAQ